MDHSVEHIEFAMVRDDLRDLPDFPLPAGYHLRQFEPGDERHWARIEMGAGEFSTVDAGLAYFRGEFGPYPDEMSERSLILEADGVGPIGTTTAWFGAFQGRPLGRIHWVAIIPEFHGRGLSKPLVGAALHILARHHDAAYLTTQTTSWRAVGLYLQLGFQPVIESLDDERAWAIVTEKLAVRQGRL